MALLLGAVGAVVGLHLVGSAVDSSVNPPPPKKKNPEPKPTHTGLTRKMHTGSYGDNAQVALILQDPTLWEETFPDVDLTGVPFMWVRARNGGLYRIYTPDNQHIKLSIVQ